MAAALKEIENLKKTTTEDIPSILMDYDIEKFEGLLKKVQNHREIVKNYEEAYDELSGSEKNSVSKQSEEANAD